MNAADAFMAIFDYKQLGEVVQTVRFPIRAVAGSNAREHWTVRAKRAKEHRQAAMVVKPVELPVIVILTRFGPRKLDSDNLAISMKMVRDGIADRLGVDDGDETKVRWEYAQAKSPGYSVLAEFVRPKQ